MLNAAVAEDPSTAIVLFRGKSSGVALMSSIGLWLWSCENVIAVKVN
ncbi:MAG: hypothetical protein IPL67_00645 [Ignavibacteria bacterium]|nr:hypothetical protein [Ignavibacteria bacterium]